MKLSNVKKNIECRIISILGENNEIQILNNKGIYVNQIIEKIGEAPLNGGGYFCVENSRMITLPKKITNNIIISKNYA